MTFADRFYNWQIEQPDQIPRSCSPNLRALLRGMQSKWPGLTDLGCWVARPVRGGDAPSTHSWGAAIDIGYPASADLEVIERQALPWLVAWSMELGIDSVHDYRRCRIWHAGRTKSPDDACTLWWRAQRPSQTTGMGQAWANHLHIETHPESWGETDEITDRGVE